MVHELNEFYLVAFDPGGTLGWARLDLSVKAFSRPEHKVLANVLDWDCGEFTGTENENLNAASLLIFDDALWSGPYQPNVQFLTEDFDLVQTIGGKTLLSPVRINAVLDWEVSKVGRKLNYQNRAMRVSMTADRLTKAGFKNPLRPETGTWSKTGKGKDAFAALQHAIVWLRRLKQESLGKPWKLSDGQVSNARWDCSCEDGERCSLLHQS